MDSVLIDSDVILDFFLAREPFGSYALRVFSLCDKNKLHGYTTSVIIANVFYIVSKESSPQKVREKLNEILKFIDTIEITKNTVLQALNSDFNDFEDALQSYAAIESGQITTILTRNVKDYKHSLLNVATPREYLKNFS